MEGKFTTGILTLAVLLGLLLVPAMGVSAGELPEIELSPTSLSFQTSEGVDSIQLTVLSTNDRHSTYLDDPYTPANPTVLGSNSTGGLARVATVFNETRTENPDTLILDAGDFMDGTAFINAENGSADLNALSYLGYDAACLGNHEMSMGPDWLALMIQNAKKDAEGKMVPLLSADIRFSATDPTDDALEALYGNEGEPGKYIFPYIVRTTASGVKVGIFGLLGRKVFMPEAMPLNTFTYEYSEIQDLINRLLNTEKVNVVICLAHASFGVTDGVPKGELTDLAKNVSGIDLIVAGHSHVKATASVDCEVPGVQWSTAIIEARGTTKYVGRADLYLEENSMTVTKIETGHIAVDDSVTADADFTEKIADFVTDIEDNYLTQFPKLKGGGLFDVLAAAPFSYGQYNGRYMVTDAMRAASGADVATCTPSETARVVPNAARNITVYEAFSAMPRSMGRDGLHGGALYKFNLLAAELQGSLEMTTCYMGQSIRDYFIVPAGVKIVFDTSKGVGSRLIKMYLVSPDELTETLIFDRSDPENFPYGGWKYAPGSTGLPGDPYQMLSVSTSLVMMMGMKNLSESDGSGGIELWPRNNVGAQVKWSLVSDLDQFVVKSGGKEVKAWYAVAQFIDSFDGGTVPDRYDDVYTDGSSNNPIGPPLRRVWDMAVAVDIKPGSDPNSINPSDQGLLPVAVLGSSSLNVSGINPETIALGGIATATRGKVQEIAYSIENVNGDEYMDLVAFFRVQDLVASEALTESTNQLTLTATLFNGDAITGNDTVRVVPPSRGGDE